MNKFSKKITDRIKDEDLKPKAKWRFVLHNSAFWGIFGLSIILGGHAIGLILLRFNAVNPRLYKQIGMNGPGLFEWAPVVWVLCFLIFINLAIWGLHHTKRGYKISVTTLVLSNLLISAVLGMGLYSSHSSERFEKFVDRHAPSFRTAEEHRESTWNKPGDGRMVGEIGDVDIINERFLWTAEDNGNKWIDYSTAMLVGDVEITEGEKVRLLIKPRITESTYYDALVISPIDMPREEFKSAIEKLKKTVEFEGFRPPRKPNNNHRPPRQQ